MSRFGYEMPTLSSNSLVVDGNRKLRGSPCMPLTPPRVAALDCGQSPTPSLRDALRGKVSLFFRSREVDSRTMASIQPEGAADLGASDRDRSPRTLSDRSPRTLSGTHFLRLLLLTPAVIWAVSPVRFLHLHPPMFAAPVLASETVSGQDVMCLYPFLAYTALMLAHVLEAGRRAKLPALSLTFRKQSRFTKAFGGCTWGLDARRMRTWTSFDIIEAAMIGGLMVAGGAPNLDVWGLKLWVRFAGLTFAFVLPFLLGVLLKRMLEAVTYVQDDRMSAWVGTIALPLLVKAIGLQVFIMSMQHIMCLAYPYVVSNSALSIMYAAGNNSRVRCDDEADFWASFQLPFKLSAARDPLDCDDRFCGYTSWVSLCQARRSAALAYSTEQFATMIVVCELCFLTVFLGLEGNRRFARGSNGELDLARLRAPHIIAIITLVVVAIFFCLVDLARFIMQAPLMMIASTPGFYADPQFTCGIGTFCKDTLRVPIICAMAAVSLLPFDTLQRFVKKGRNTGPSFFLSYKQKDGNDGTVQQLFDLLRDRGSKAWLDKRAEDRSEKGMVAGVKSSDVFVAVLSPAYFTSWFCCLEMHTAITERKPILVVWNQTEYAVQKALGWIPEALQFLKENELLPIQEDIQMALPCVARIQASKVAPTTIKEAPPIKAFQQPALTGGGGGDLQSVVLELKQAHVRMQEELEQLRFRGSTHEA